MTILRNFFTYSFGALLLRGITVITTPLLLAKIPPDQYGALSLITSSIGIITPLVGLGLRQILPLEYFHVQKKERFKLINDIIIIYIAIASPLFLLLYFYHQTLGSYININNSTLILLGLVIAFLFFFIELFYQVLRYEQKSLALVITQLIIAIITAGTTIMLVYCYSESIASVLTAQCCGTVCGCIIGFSAYIRSHAHHHINVRHSLQRSRYYLSYGLPFVPNMLFAWILAYSDRFMLSHYTTLHNVGIYSIADLSGQLFQLFILNPWAGSYLPDILQQYATHKNRVLEIEQKNQKTMLICMVTITTTIIIGYYIGKSLLHVLLPPLYHEAIPQIRTILLGYVFLLGTYFTTSLIQFCKKVSFLSLGLAIPSLCNIALNYLLIPTWGLTGCTYATLSAYCVYFIITLCYNHYLQYQISIS